MDTKVIFTPFYNGHNGYIDIMKFAYKTAGTQVLPFRSVKNLFSADYAVLNWYESISPSKVPFKKIFWFLIRYFTIIFLKIRNVKIIWTLHNKEPHNRHFAELSIIMMKFLAKNSDFIVIHSSASIKTLEKLVKNKFFEYKTILIPHPNYGNYYGNPIERDILNNEKLQLLFLGGNAKHKNLEILIEAVKELNLPNLDLKIADEYIPNDLIARYISNCHALIIPYDTKTMLNSGTVMLAFSYKRTVISPSIGTLEDIGDKTLFFDYSYSCNKEHREKLSETIMKIYYEYEGKYDNLLNIGKKCFDYVEKNNGIEKIALALKMKIFEGGNYV